MTTRADLDFEWLVPKGERLEMVKHIIRLCKHGKNNLYKEISNNDNK